jgi:hypothetical protein
MRQNWLSEGKTGKPVLPSGRYLTYAIGEIALVVIGILIALSINNWNEDRNERELEKELLVELLTTVKTNQGLLSRGLERWQSTTEAIDLIMHVLDHQLPYADSLAVYFAEAHRKRGNNLNSLNFSGYKSLENRGFNLIRNRELKIEIIILFEQRLTSLATASSQLDIDNSSFHYEYIAKNFELRYSRETPHDYEKILNDPFYYSILVSLDNSMSRKENRVKRFLNDNQRVLELLEAELAILSGSKK